MGQNHHHGAMFDQNLYPRTRTLWPKVPNLLCEIKITICGNVLWSKSPSLSYLPLHFPHANYDRYIMSWTAMHCLLRIIPIKQQMIWKQAQQSKHCQGSQHKNLKKKFLYFPWSGHKFPWQFLTFCKKFYLAYDKNNCNIFQIKITIFFYFMRISI